MIGATVTGINIKTLLAILSAVALIGSAAVYTPGTTNSDSVQVLNTHTIDPFTTDIQERSDLVYNAVSEAVNQQGEQKPLIYKQTCESSIGFIRGERLDTNNNYNTLDAGQKELINDYREYLKEAANVVSVAYSGETPDLTKMNELKAELY